MSFALKLTMAALHSPELHPGHPLLHEGTTMASFGTSVALPTLNYGTGWPSATELPHVPLDKVEHVLSSNAMDATRRMLYVARLHGCHPQHGNSLHPSH